MPRIRSIKPDACRSRDFAALSRECRYFFQQLWCFMDDDGRIKYLPKELAGMMYPYDDDVDARMIEGWVRECTTQGVLVEYSANGSRYLAAPSWESHQRVDKPSPSRCPAPPQELLDIIAVKVSGEPVNVNSANTPRILHEVSANPPPLDMGYGNMDMGDIYGGEKQNSDGDNTPIQVSTPQRKSRPKFQIPTQEEVLTAMLEKGWPPPLAVEESSKFWCHFEEKNWKDVKDLGLRIIKWGGGIWHPDYNRGNPPTPKQAPGYKKPLEGDEIRAWLDAQDNGR